MKKISLIAICGLICSAAGADMVPLTGFYKTIDDETGNAKSIVRLYECAEINDDDDDRDELCGRIVALYDTDGKAIAETLANPIRSADKVKNSPKMVGLDIIWGMEWDDDDNEYEDGKILDPKSGKIYSSVIWADKKDSNVLNVRGKIGPFGRTQKWHVVNVADLPTELQNLNVAEWTVKINK